MFLVTFTETIEIAKYPADVKTIKLTSPNRKHTFHSGGVVLAVSIKNKNSFVELYLDKPINSYRRWYLPIEYYEYIEIKDVSSVSSRETTCA
jgi:hypothetical protein